MPRRGDVFYVAHPRLVSRNYSHRGVIGHLFGRVFGSGNVLGLLVSEPF